MLMMMVMVMLMLMLMATVTVTATVMTVTLTCDHRVVDGMLGGSFVKRVATYLEEFDLNRSVV